MVKIFILITVCALTFLLCAKANKNCNRISSKSGVTIYYKASCDSREQSFIDSITRKVVSLLNRTDTSLKILVLINQGQLNFPNSRSSHFISIGYDTLRLIDDNYILKYYLQQENNSTKQNHGFSTFESRKLPIDINFTEDTLVNDVGIKIIYDRDYNLNESNWTEIINAIVFASKNAGLIRKSQKRDTVQFHMNGWYVSLVTLDTFSINKISGKAITPEPAKQDILSEKTTHLVPGLAVFLAIVILIFVLKKYRSK